MRSDPISAFHSLSAYRLAAILGTNEIASAIAVTLTKTGRRVILCHDPFPPVIRRRMSFHDALFGETAEVEGIVGERAETALEIATVLAKPDHVAVMPLHLIDLIALYSPNLLIDARMQKHRVTPDYRGIVGLTVGLGPNFAVGVNCDVAIETRPARNGEIVRSGCTDPADGQSRMLGGVGRERFVYSDQRGRFRTELEIGAEVPKGAVVGYLDDHGIAAPIAGVIRGLARDGSLVPADVKLVEIDARGEAAQWTGTDARGRAIAEASLRAIRLESSRRPSRDDVGLPALI